MPYTTVIDDEDDNLAAYHNELVAGLEALEALGLLTNTWTVGDGTSNTSIGVWGDKGFVRDLHFYSTLAGVKSLRWVLRANATSESGANAGTDLELLARDDAGASIGNVFTIYRATRQINFGHTTDATSSTTGAVIFGGGVGIAKSLYVGTSILSVSPTAGIGYTTGAGGTVTQATSKSTGVTLNKVTGAITMNNAALAADTTVSFTLTNSAIAATDTIILNHVSGGTAGSYLLNAQPAAGSASINVRNITAGSLSEAIVIRYTVIKSVSA